MNAINLNRYPEPGDVFVYTMPMRNPVNKHYPAGYKIQLVKKTNDVPFGYKSAFGNWVVREEDETVSVWSSIDFLILTDVLEYKTNSRYINSYADISIQ